MTVVLGVPALILLIVFAVLLVIKSMRAAGPFRHAHAKLQRSLPPLPRSPLGIMDFATALEGDLLAIGVSEFGRDALNYSLSAQGANLVIQSIEAGEHFGEMNIIYEFSREGAEMVKQGVAKIATHSSTGKLLPELQDRSGRIFELAKGHKDVLGKLASVSALVISMAHIIASIDTLKRLKRIEIKLDQILLGRKNDHLAKLERIYVRTGELLLTVPYSQTSFRLDQYRDELYELRSLWRREIERLMDIAPDPNVKEWWNRPDLKVVLANSPGMGWLLNGFVGWYEGKRREDKEKELVEHLKPLIEIVCCLRLALLVDVCIAQWTGSMEALYAHTLRNEAAMWDGVAAILAKVKTSTTSGGGSEKMNLVELMIGAIEAYVEALNGVAGVAVPA